MLPRSQRPVRRFMYIHRMPLPSYHGSPRFVPSPPKQATPPRGLFFLPPPAPPSLCFLSPRTRVSLERGSRKELPHASAGRGGSRRRTGKGGNTHMTRTGHAPNLPPHAGGAAVRAFVCARRMREGGDGAGGGTKALRCAATPCSTPLFSPVTSRFGSVGALPGPAEGNGSPHCSRFSFGVGTVRSPTAPHSEPPHLDETKIRHF